MDVEFIIMGFLMSGPRTGYELKNITGKFLLTYNLSLNQIYPTLRKFEEAGLVKKKVIVQTNKPNKHIITITKKGREIFMKWITAPSRPIEYSIDFLNRATFFRFLDKTQILKLFETEINSLDQQLDDLESMRSTIEEKADENGTFVYGTAVKLMGALKELYQNEMKRRKS
jgi:DNA-binding PadR family transcriptional regulator